MKYWNLIKHLGTFHSNSRYTKELNLVSFNNADPVIDIRKWTKDEDGEPFPCKGISLNRESAIKLYALLGEYLQQTPAAPADPEDNPAPRQINRTAWEKEMSAELDKMYEEEEDLI